MDNLENMNVQNQAEQKDPNNKKGKRKPKVKWIVISSVTLFVLLRALLCTLFLLPVYSFDIPENTAKELLLATDELEELVYSFEDIEGYEGAVEVKLPSKMTNFENDIYIKSDIESYKKNGIMVVELGGGENKYSLELLCDEEYIAIKGLYREENRHLVLPRDNVRQAFEQSIFHPTSGSEYALKESDYDDLVNTIEGFNNTDEDETYDPDEIGKEIYGIISEIDWKVFPKNSFKYSFSKMALERTVTYSLDKEDMEKVYDVIIEAYPKCEHLSEMFANVDVIGKCKNLKRALKDDQTIEFSYTVCKKRIIKITYEERNYYENDRTKTEETTATFNYASKHSSLNILSTTVVDEKNYKTTKEYGLHLKVTNTEDEYTLEAKSWNELTKKSKETNNKTPSIWDDKGHNKDVTKNVNGSAETEFSFVINKKEGDYTLKIGQDSTNTEYSGKIKADKETGNISFSLDSVNSGKDQLNKEPVITLEIKPRQSDVRAIISKPTSLLEMSEEEFAQFSRKIPFEKLEAVYKYCNPNDTLFGYTVEGDVIYDKARLAELTKEYLTAYSKYITETCIELNIAPDTKIFTYYKELDLYFIAEYYPENGYVMVVYSYEATEDMLEGCHEAVIDKNGKMELHKLTLEKQIDPSCTREGQRIYHCSVCDKNVISIISKDSHTYVEKSISVNTDDNSVRSASVTLCDKCGCIYKVIIDDYCTFYLTHVEEDCYELVSYTSKSEIKYFSIPKELGISVVIGECGNFDIVRIPRNNEVIKSGSFKGSKSNDVQVLIIPDTVCEIEDDAFGEGEKLHAIFFEGSARQWEKVKKNGYQNKWNDIEVIFCPEGADRAKINAAYIKLKTSKEISNIQSANWTISSNAEMFKDQRLSFIGGDGVMQTVDYCPKTDTIAILYKSLDVKLYSSEGELKDSFHLNIANIHYMKIYENYVVFASSGADRVYIYHLESGQTEVVKIPAGNRVRTLAADSGMVYIGLTNDTAGKVMCYNIAEKKLTELIKKIEFPDFHHNKQEGKLVVVPNQLEISTVYVIDTKKGEIITELSDESGFSVSQLYAAKYIITSAGDFYTFEGEKAEGVSNDLTIIKQGASRCKYKDVLINPYFAICVMAENGGKLYTVVKTGENEIELPSFYASTAIILNSSDILVYVYGGNGVILVDMP